jgi:hypothetical protein
MRSASGVLRAYLIQATEGTLGLSDNDHRPESTGRRTPICALGINVGDPERRDTVNGMSLTLYQFRENK